MMLEEISASLSYTDERNNYKKTFMIRKILIATLVICTAWACEREEQQSSTAERYTARVAVEAEDVVSRAYDADLNWSWEATDALTGYQVAGLNLRNTLSYIEASAGFVCEAFEYMSTDPAQFHFIYPAAAEVEQGVLVAVQSGKWQPLSVMTTEASVIDTLPSLSFEVLSAALEIRVFDTDKSTPIVVTGATLSAATDWVGRWTLNEDMTYTQGYSGTTAVVENAEFNDSVVVFNMPDYPAGVEAGFFTLVLNREDGTKMTATLPALSFVKGKRTVLNIVYVADPEEGGDSGDSGDSGEGGEDPDTPVTPEPEEPQVITGTFTCATYNVDGLPSIANSDGPGSSGTNTISSTLATSGWDFIAFQENFEYNSNLQSSMTSAYTFGSHRGSVGVGQLFGSKADTDGLNFAMLKSSCSFSGETFNSFTDTYGGLTDGANTCIDKGFRYYLVTMADGVEFDVLVTHMNSGSDSGHISARESQLKQMAAYVNTITAANNRPVIILGDTNCRYTRDDMFGCFYDLLNSNLTHADPWVVYSWDGVYPTLGSASLMVPSKDSSSIYTEQTGEVVDKIIYINVADAPTQIVANDYMNDTAYAGMADHNPVRSTFTYTYTATE